jgi:hypothetical protein
MQAEKKKKLQEFSKELRDKDTRIVKLMEASRHPRQQVKAGMQFSCWNPRVVYVWPPHIYNCYMVASYKIIYFVAEPKLVRSTRHPTQPGSFDPLLTS